MKITTAAATKSLKVQQHTAEMTSIYFTKLFKRRIFLVGSKKYKQLILKAKNT